MGQYGAAEGGTATRGPGAAVAIGFDRVPTLRAGERRLAPTATFTVEGPNHPRADAGERPRARLVGAVRLRRAGHEDVAGTAELLMTDERILGVIVDGAGPGAFAIQWRAVRTISGSADRIVLKGDGWAMASAFTTRLDESFQVIGAVANDDVHSAVARFHAKVVGPPAPPASAPTRNGTEVSPPPRSVPDSPPPPPSSPPPPPTPTPPPSPPDRSRGPNPPPRPRPAPRPWGNGSGPGGRPIRRVIDALCYLITGVTILVMTLNAPPDIEVPAYAALVGGFFLLVGLYIYFSRGSYWVSAWIYVISLGAISFVASSVM